MIDSTNKRVLITGINGFTGRYMEKELIDAGYSVYGLGSHACERENYFQVDLLKDQQNLAEVITEVQPSMVVHLAAIAFVAYGGDPNAFYQINLIGTRNLLLSLAENAKNLKSVLVASSANVYGNSVSEFLDETVAPAPANDYAVSKLAMEYMANLWIGRLPLFIVRPFNYTGIGQTENFLLPKIVSHFRKQAPSIELGNLEVWRDFGDVRAVVQAYRKLLECSPLGQTVNVCSGKTYSLQEIISMAEEITGHSIEVRVNPAFVRANEVNRLCGDASRLQSLIGEWNMPPLKETLSWMLMS